MEPFNPVLPYVAIDLRIIATRHLLLPITIHHLNLLFLLDTGASATCIELQTAETLRLTLEKNTEQLTSATGTETEGFTEAMADQLQIGSLSIKQQPVAVLNLQHINQRLEQMAGLQVQGILGADVLLALQAVIDFEQAKLYLKER